MLVTLRFYACLFASKTSKYGFSAGGVPFPAKQKLCP